MESCELGLCLGLVLVVLGAKVGLVAIVKVTVQAICLVETSANVEDAVFVGT